MAPTPLSVHVLYSQLLKIATIKRPGAAKTKGDIVKKLLVQTKGEEVRYLVRTLVRHPRIGAVRLVSGTHFWPIDIYTWLYPLTNK
jgi:DNA ligase-1